MTGWWIGVALIPAAGLIVWALLVRSLRGVFEVRDALKARELFRRDREWLECRFLSALARHEPLERIRWEDAAWQNDVTWARDRRSRRLQALVGVQFEVNPFDDEAHPEHATAVFEFRAGAWQAEGRHFDFLQPLEAFQRNARLEPIEMPRT